MVENEQGYSRKDLGSYVIYRETAKLLGILDKIDGNPWFKLYKITLNTGQEIKYYRPNFVDGKFPWGDKPFEVLLKEYVIESKENVLFSYDPNDFEKAINAMKRFVEDESNGKMRAFEVGESCRYAESVPEIPEIKHELSAEALIQQDLIDEIEARINDK